MKVLNFDPKANISQCVSVSLVHPNSELDISWTPAPSQVGHGGITKWLLPFSCFECGDVKGTCPGDDGSGENEGIHPRSTWCSESTGAGRAFDGAEPIVSYFLFISRSASHLATARYLTTRFY